MMSLLSTEKSNAIDKDTVKFLAKIKLLTCK